ncbi:MAG: ribosomal RNA small subunit methyltransferase I [Candidatus Hodgkinia cicadicola]
MISTPIGNMLDITLRALITLRTDVVLCENPSVTKKLLSYYKIRNRAYKLNKLNCCNAAKLKRDVCLVSDAGTPLISDPGCKAISFLFNQNYNISAIPGACAVTCALACARMPANRFVFAGFLSKSKRKAKAQLIKYTSIGLTTVLFESPRRVISTIRAIIEVVGRSSKLALCAELTKLNELSIRGCAASVYSRLRKLRPTGEITLMVWSKTVLRSNNNANLNELAKLAKLAKRARALKSI